MKLRTSWTARGGASPRIVQAGGWTRHWQGLEDDAELPHGETIYAALRRLAPTDARVELAVGCAIVSPDGCGNQRVYIPSDLPK